MSKNMKTINALVDLLSEAIDCIQPNETEYKCNYRIEYIKEKLEKIIKEM